MENQETHLLDEILEVALGILQPVTDLLQDPVRREEYFALLGLTPDPAPPPPVFHARAAQQRASRGAGDNLSDLAQVKKYTDGVKEIMGDVKAIRQIIDDVRDNDGSIDWNQFAAELVTALINLGTTEYLRKKSPKTELVFEMLKVVDETNLRKEGNQYIWEDVVDIVQEAFAFGNSKTDEENERAFTRSMQIVGLGLLAFDFICGWPITLRQGYESYPTSPTQLADAASNRALIVSFNKEIFVPKEDGPASTITAGGSVAIVPLPRTHLGGGVALMILGLGDTPAIPLTKEWSLAVKSKPGAVFIISKDRGFDAQLADASSFKVAVERKRAIKKKKWLSILKVGFGDMGIQLEADKSKGDIALRNHIKVAVEFGNGGSKKFPLKLLPDKALDETVDIPFGVSYKRGFFLDGFGNFETGGFGQSDKSAARLSRASGEPPKDKNLFTLPIPVHKSLGPITFDKVYLGAQSDGAKHGLEASLDFTVRFGSAVTITLSRIGALMTLQKAPEGEDGLFGQDFGIQFKPPTGAGIVIDAKMIKGGGFLYFDEAKGEYFGALELSFSGLFSMQAIGIINTKMPDGSDGFSMVILISAEFKPIQLGLGFTLLGVGGLLGLNRTINLGVLQEGLKTGILDSVLFPKNVIANINRIISDLKSVFPQKGSDALLVGLMAKFGWGTPTRIAIDLGLILELPNPRLVLVGTLRCILPDERAPLLKLQINFMGAVDFQKRFLFFRADLYESKLLGFPLYGSLVLAISWGNPKSFVLSAGGFHRDFDLKNLPVIPDAPGLFKKLDRLSIVFIDDENLSLKAEAYFAVTSNTVQFGTEVELYVDGPRSFNIYGKTSFHALFYFEPFRFQFDIDVELWLRSGDDHIMGLKVEGQLTGPTPYHIRGSATFEICWIDFSIDFEKTWGSQAPHLEELTVDLSALLRQELSDSRNWQVEKPDKHHEAVSLRKIKTEDQISVEELLLQPFGSIVFTQRNLPLDTPIKKMGVKKPKTAGSLSISAVKCGSTTFADETVEEMFAPDHFFELTEQEKLSRRSFESMPGGFRIKDSDKRTVSNNADLAPLEVKYELIYKEDEAGVKSVKGDLDKLHFIKMRNHAAMANSSLSKRVKNPASALAPRPVVHKSDWFTLAQKDDLKSADGKPPADTQRSHSQSILAEQIKTAAKQRAAPKNLQVVSLYELA